MFHLIGWIVFGFIIGLIAKIVMPGKDPGGSVVTILLGIAGAVLGGFLARSIGWYGPADSAGFFVSLAGSILLLWLYRQFLLRRA